MHTLKSGTEYNIVIPKEADSNNPSWTEFFIRARDMIIALYDNYSTAKGNASSNDPTDRLQDGLDESGEDKNANKLNFSKDGRDGRDISISNSNGAKVTLTPADPHSPPKIILTNSSTKGHIIDILLQRQKQTWELLPSSAGLPHDLSEVGDADSNSNSIMQLWRAIEREFEELSTRTQQKSIAERAGQEANNTTPATDVDNASKAMDLHDKEDERTRGIG